MQKERGICGWCMSSGSWKPATRLRQAGTMALSVSEQCSFPSVVLSQPHTWCESSRSLLLAGNKSSSCHPGDSESQMWAGLHCVSLKQLPEKNYPMVQANCRCLSVLILSIAPARMACASTASKFSERKVRGSDRLMLGWHQCLREIIWTCFPNNYNHLALT